MEYNWKNKVILVVEDVANNFLLVKKSLKKTEVELIWAKNGLEAVDEFKQNPNIDLVLMDIRMPIMNGLEATKQIRQNNNEKYQHQCRDQTTSNNKRFEWLERLTTLKHVVPRATA